MVDYKEQANLTLQQVQLIWINRISELIGEKMRASDKNAIIEWHLNYLDATVPPSLKEKNPMKYPDDLHEEDKEILKNKRNNLYFHKIMEWVSIQNNWYERSQRGDFDEFSD